MRRLLIAGLAVGFAVLTTVGCGSSVKLNDNVKVEDGVTQTAVATKPVASAPQPIATPTTALTTPTDQRQVAGVSVPAAAEQGATPPNLSRLVYFDYDSYEIKPEFQAALDAHARFLKAVTSRRVSLEGHTDERGGREYNLALGQKRSEAVARALRVLGVLDPQMEAVSFGKEKPAAAGADEATWARNRRVELFYK